MLLGDGDGPVVTTAITYYYLNGQRVAQAKDGVFTWIHADHLSSATRITDVNGLEIRRLAYAAFGEEAENQGTGDDPKYTYTGKEHDATGLYYYGARYYDPALSRFITADTVYDAGPQGLNRYSYALNNPLRYIDPTGHQVEHWYETVWVNPIEEAQETVNAGLAWIDEASGYHPYVVANTVPIKTISDTNFGALKSGLGVVPLGEQIGEWVADPKDYNKIPVVGPIGKEVGESYADVYMDPNVETGSRAVAATASAVGTALGGVQAARMLGVPGTQGNPIKTPKSGVQDPPGTYRDAHGRLRDSKTHRFVSDPNNPPSPYEYTDAQRRADWKRLAEDPNSPLTPQQRAAIKARGWRGPQRINPETGELETMELSHEPVPLRDGGTEVVPRWPDEHAAIDPHRHLKKEE